jgi:hypothetical protein
MELYINLMVIQHHRLKHDESGLSHTAVFGRVASKTNYLGGHQIIESHDTVTPRGFEAGVAAQTQPPTNIRLKS